MRKNLIAFVKRAYISATPAVFAAHIISLSNSLDPRFKDKFSYEGNYPPPSDLTIAEIDFEGGKLTVKQLPGINSHLIIQIDDAFDTPNVIKEIEKDISDLGWFVRLNNQSQDDEVVDENEHCEPSDEVEPNWQVNPWELIEGEINQNIVRMVYEGKTDREIAVMIGRAPQTISNKLYKLRKQYKELVPKRYIVKDSE